MPKLVAKSLDQQCTSGFDDFVDDVFPNIYYCYNNRVEVYQFDFACRKHEYGKELD
ncbi:hypothetical protein PITC_095390 [Penicillium italicum]|uniref:Uncharacterized protein n=1 Tax=Penicillium italicum TaxID=40296 RepID=A0A0A2KNE1_PENIT|nr:hypothetical protein PITC_095390 [Penicillium italicum]